MNRKTFAAVLALSAVALAGCGQGHVKGNHAICYTFRPSGAAPAASASPAAAAAAAPTVTPIDDCLRRWAYTLAPSRDPANMVSDAVVAACTGDLARWNEQALNQGTTQIQAPSLTTGEPTNPMAEHDALAHGRALLYVVEARAGRCAPPPVVNGAPEG